jgi:hypothetical protein
MVEAERWEIEVTPEVAEWLGGNQSNLAAEINSLADRRGLDVQVLPSGGGPGQRDVAAVLLATAAVIKALTPIVLALIKTRFPNAVVEEDHSGRRKKLIMASR